MIPTLTAVPCRIILCVYLVKGNGLRWAMAPPRPFELSTYKPVSHDWHGFVDSHAGCLFHGKGKNDNKMPPLCDSNSDLYLVFCT